MRASVLTLTTALGFIPKVVSMRYPSDTFRVSKGNAILMDIEKKCTAEYYKKEYPLVLLDGITDYAINDEIRLIRGLYEVPGGEVIPDYDNPVSFQLRGNDIRLGTVPIVNTEDDIDSAVTGPSGTLRDRFADTVELGGITENSLKGALCVYTDDSLSRTINRIVVGNDPDNDLCLLNGELPEVPTSSDTYVIYKNYFMIDAIRYLTRLTDPADVIDIPIDLEELFVAGLRFYYENQTDQESSKSKSAAAEYGRQLKEFASDENRKVGSNPKPVPRSIPDIGSHGTEYTNRHLIL